MPLETDKDEERLWLVTVNGPTGTAGLHAFRGDLVGLPGELNRAAGRREPWGAV